MWVASFRTSAAVNPVFILLAITFWLLAIGNAGANTNIIKIGGYIGLATAAAAWYASFAAVTNSTFKRTVLPVMPLSRPGRRATRPRPGRRRQGVEPSRRGGAGARALAPPAPWRYPTRDLQ